MKKIGALLVVLALFGCGNSKSVVVDFEPEDETWEYGDINTYAVNPRVSGDTSRVEIYYTIARPNSELKTVTDSLAATYLDIYCCPDDSEQLNRQTFEEYAVSFLQDYIDVIVRDSSSTFPWRLALSIDFCYINEHYVKAEFLREAYMGGAHGNADFTSCMIDVTSNLVVKLEDICSDIPELEKRAEVYFRKAYGIAPGADLSAEGFWFQDNKFHLNRNFSFSGEEILFVFNQYEIAPYFMGVFEVEIPFSEITDLINIKR